MIYTGLDIGTSSVKIVQLEKKDKSFKLIKFGIEKIPSEIKETNKQKNFIIKAINKIIEEKKIKAEKVITVLPGSSVIVRNVLLPKMPKEELREVVKYEAEQYLPFPPEEGILDFLVLGEVKDKEGERTEVVVAAAQKKVVEEHISLIQQAGFKLESIAVSTFALQNSLEKQMEGITALINIGAGITNINVFQDKVLYFVRDIFMGGDNWTSAVADALKIDFSAAERVKEKYGIRETKEKEAHLISNAIKLELGQLLGEIHRSFDYCKAQIHKRKIDKVILSGGSAKLKNLDKFLAEDLEVKVALGDPFSHIEFDKKVFPEIHLKEIGPSLSVGIGLAQSGEIRERINLLPPELEKRKLQLDLSSFKTTIIPIGALCLVLLFMFMGIFCKTKSYDKKIKVKQKEMEKIHLIVAQARKIKEEKAKLEKRKALFTKLVGKRLLWSNVFKEMGSVIPEGVWLQGLSLNKITILDPEKKTMVETQNWRIEIKGSAFNNQLVAEYMLSLKRLPYIKEVDLNFTNKRDLKESEVIDFAIICKYEANDGKEQ